MGELRLLGPVEVRTADGVALGGEPRRLAVLAALAVDAGRVVQATTLIDRVWGEDPPGQAARTLGTYITRIRRMLEQSFGDVTVVNHPGGYRLTAARDQVDLTRFRDLVARSRASSCTPESRVELLRQSVSLHRGDPLTGVSGEWAVTPFTVTEDFSGTVLTPLQWAANQAQRENGSSWSPGAVRVGGGELQISGTGRNPTGAGNVAGAVCWCLEQGIVRTYGVWEVRAKFDVGSGYAPALGLYSSVDPDTPGWGFMTMARFDEGDRRVMYPVMRGAGSEHVDGAPVAGDFTTWNTYAIEWRPGFVTVSLNGAVILDTRKLPGPVRIPTVPMYLYVQINPGPEGSIPAPNQETPSQVAAHVDWARYTS
ncbi:winged helix-turn-helix domain-containing protein [Paractinoplanes lichenicola]|uniref:Winged helix-turn-helix domain-containing protein n=1 Tax=Paractinoplanes lichenicola TaxID=2802976 RepID=A0ABS1W0N0_9ACTN|nr:winged helix-turn-helix domain-containing protein [Actinoplanes lichenicola]MBL7260287.1 winged helix-turn-helix domain-containing protein [Actinoplanes lichenicola]